MKIRQLFRYVSNVSIYRLASSRYDECNLAAAISMIARHASQLNTTLFWPNFRASISLERPIPVFWLASYLMTLKLRKTFSIFATHF